MAVSGAHQSIGDQNEIYGQEISEELIQARMSKVEQLHSIFMSSQAKFAEMLTNLGWKKDSSQVRVFPLSIFIVVDFLKLK